MIPTDTALRLAAERQRELEHRAARHRLARHLANHHRRTRSIDMVLPTLRRIATAASQPRHPAIEVAPVVAPTERCCAA